MMESYEHLKSEADQVTEEAQQYFNLQKERLQIEVIERLTNSLSALFFILAVVLFASAGIFLACIVVAFIAQQMFDNWLISALCTSAFFALLLYLTLGRGRTMMKDAIARAIISSVYE